MPVIRQIWEADAAAFLDLQKRLDEETRFMLCEPGERRTTVRIQRRRIQETLAEDNSTIFVAEHDGALVGYLGAYGGQFRRIRHRAQIVIGILAAFTGQGLGTRLFAALESWARAQGLHRLELTVMTHNRAALALYRKMGFQVEGRRRHAIRLGDAYVDEYAMARLLD